jgi:hypothetical protein
MECAAGTDKIKVAPQGCKPVSEDRCASGFMAPAGNVTFPKNPLETCCKCKEGESCPYCLDEDACTQDEKKRYVTDKDCFEKPKPPVKDISQDTKNLEQIIKPSFWKKNIWVILVLLGVGLWFAPIKPMWWKFVIYGIALATWIFSTFI